jgi:hypothetical protein
VVLVSAVALTIRDAGPGQGQADVPPVASQEPAPMPAVTT